MEYIDWKHGKAHQQELLRQAHAAHLAKLATGERPNRLSRLVMAKLGAVMVAFGRLLHQRYAPPAPRRTYLIPETPSQSIAQWYASSKNCEQESNSRDRVSGRLFSVTRGHSSTRKKNNQ